MIPDNFFSLLSSKNKRIYLACILQSFKTYETGSILGIEKKIIVDDLINFLDKSSYLYDVEDEEDEDDEEDLPAYSKKGKKLAVMMEADKDQDIE